MSVGMSGYACPGGHNHIGHTQVAEQKPPDSVYQIALLSLRVLAQEMERLRSSAMGVELDASAAAGARAAGRCGYPHVHACPCTRLAHGVCTLVHTHAVLW